MCMFTSSILAPVYTPRGVQMEMYRVSMGHTGGRSHSFFFFILFERPTFPPAVLALVIPTGRVQFSLFLVYREDRGYEEICGRDAPPSSSPQIQLRLSSTGPRNSSEFLVDDAWRCSNGWLLWVYTQPLGFEKFTSDRALLLLGVRR